MPKFAETLESVYASDRPTWRQWLTEHHHTAPGIWLIYYKRQSGKPSVQYREAVREALCFGWIDSKVKSLDTERYKQIFTPRKPKSVWSKLNKQYIEELIRDGLMTPAGLEKIVTAQQDGSWTTLDNIEALVIPPDLQQILSTDPIAYQFFEQFSKTTKKNILVWLSTAKRPETRTRRLEQTLQAVRQNQNPLIKTDV